MPRSIVVLLIQFVLLLLLWMLSIGFTRFSICHCQILFFRSSAVFLKIPFVALRAMAKLRLLPTFLARIWARPGRQHRWCFFPHPCCTTKHSCQQTCHLKFTKTPTIPDDANGSLHSRPTTSRYRNNNKKAYAYAHGAIALSTACS